MKPAHAHLKLVWFLEENNGVLMKELEKKIKCDNAILKDVCIRMNWTRRKCMKNGEFALNIWNHHENTQAIISCIFVVLISQFLEKIGFTLLSLALFCYSTSSCHWGNLILKYPQDNN